MASLKQKIAQKEDEIARLKKQEIKIENGQKIVIGGMMMSLARKNKNIASLLLESIEKNVTRETDKKRLVDFIEELETLILENEGIGTNEIT